MQLRKQSNPSAKWDNENNKWCIGESRIYQWTDMKNRPVSDWMNLDDALIWIKEYNESKETN
jgi:hypothetical protein